MTEQNINTQSKITASDGDEISLKELIQKIKEWVAYLKMHWKIIFFAGVLGASIGVVNAYFQKPTYKAVLTFVLEEDKGGGGLSGLGGVVSQFGFDIGGSNGFGAFAGSNLTELMKSRLLVEKTLLNPVVINGDTISLAEYYIRINKIREAWASNTIFKNIQFLPTENRSNYSIQQDSILFNIYLSLVSPKALSISQKEKKASITSIEVTSYNENFAKIFCENLAKETSQFYIETKSKKAKINLNILELQADSIRAELNSAITGVAIANDNVFNLNSAMVVKKTPSAHRQVDVQANTAILTSVVTNLEMAKISLRKETPLIQIIDRPILPLEKEKTSKLKALLLGGFLGVFLTALYLVFSSLYKKIIA